MVDPAEYAKDVVWEGRDYLLSDQIYLFAKQNRKQVRLYGKVDVVVTDCPLMLSYYYSGDEDILALIRKEMKRARQLHIMLMSATSATDMIPGIVTPVSGSNWLTR